MKLAIVGYPEFEAPDRRWIKSFRAQHDPQASRIPAHVTLVFPFEAVADDVGLEVRTIARATPRIALSIRRSHLVADVVGGGTLVCLVPDEGTAEIVALHDRLYAGALGAHVRADIPYVPHVTVGAAGNTTAAARLATELAAAARLIRGRIDRIDLVDLGQPVVRSITRHGLSGDPNGAAWRQR
jgi:2'-5' RNA ligase